MTMAEPRAAAAATALRVFVSVVAVATTVGSALAMSVHDGHAASPSARDAPSLAGPSSLEPLPSLEPTAAAAAPRVPARRPAPLATTRSSR
jgi:hypothetical protein